MNYEQMYKETRRWIESIYPELGHEKQMLAEKFFPELNLFTQEHCPKENNVNEETNVPTGYGKYVDECLNEATKHFFSEGEDTYSIADLFYAGVRCGQSWLEKQKSIASDINIWE